VRRWEFNLAITFVKPSQYLDKKTILRVAAEVFSFLGEEFEVGVKFACENCIRGLNKQYRGKDEPTNVLSFNNEEHNKNGDIVICESFVEGEAKELKTEVSDLELLYLVHGMLHLAGFDHTKPGERDKMEEIEKNILAKVGIKVER